MESSSEYMFSELLKQFRVRGHISQQELAEKLHVHRNTISAWERGDSLPKTRPLVLEVARALRLKQTDRDALLQASFWKRPKSSFWNVPRRNPFFTGREDVLKHLHDALTGETRAAVLTQPQALSGLGGIGKTQTAVEYAYRHREDYRALLWAQADLPEVLITECTRIAELLNLAEKQERDQSRIVEAFRRWLQDTPDWLLILDNVEDLAMVSDFLPETTRGHILLTTRAQGMGPFAQRITLKTMTPEEGAYFLIRRANLIEPGTPINKTAADWTKAITITEMMDALPLALDQAAAYIEETDRSLSEYLELYETQRSALLKWRGEVASDHPEPVATTWALSFEKVEQANPAAAELLRLCAFLHPDAIPEEIITEGAPDLGPTLQPVTADPLKLASALQELRKFSLVRRDRDAKVLNIHRLVQAVLKDSMNAQVQRQWAERSVRAVNRAFPAVEFAAWERCQRCLPQVQVCVTLIKQEQMAFPEAARLLHQVGAYLGEHAQYERAEPLLLQAQAIYEQVRGAEHHDVAQVLDTLGTHYYYEGKYAQSELLTQRVLEIRQKILGPQHPELAESFNNLAMLCYEQGKYVQAEPLFQQALTIRKQALGLEHPDVAQILNNLGRLYYEQGKYTQAKSLFQQALTMREQTLAPDHPDIAQNLANLAQLHLAQGIYTLAEPLLQRAVTTWKQTRRLQHPEVVAFLKNYVQLLRQGGKEAEAAALEARTKASSYDKLPERR